MPRRPARLRMGGMRIGLTAAAAEVEGTLFRQEGEYWTVVFDGSAVRPRAPIAWNADPGHRSPGLNTGAPALNAHSADEGSARRRSRGPRSRHPWEAAAVLIRLWVQGSQPLVAAAPSSAEDADAAG